MKQFSVARRASINLHIEAFHPAMSLKRLAEGGEPVANILVFGRYWHKHTDAPHAVALLRARNERPRHRAAEERDELAAEQSRSGRELPRAPRTDPYVQL